MESLHPLRVGALTPVQQRQEEQRPPFQTRTARIRSRFGVALPPHRSLDTTDAHRFTIFVLATIWPLLELFSLTRPVNSQEDTVLCRLFMIHTSWCAGSTYKSIFQESASAHAGGIASQKGVYALLQSQTPFFYNSLSWSSLIATRFILFRRLLFPSSNNSRLTSCNHTIISCGAMGKMSGRQSVLRNDVVDEGGWIRQDPPQGNSSFLAHTFWIGQFRS